jgi:hypothetical protein
MEKAAIKIWKAKVNDRECSNKNLEGKYLQYSNK